MKKTILFLLILGVVGFLALTAFSEGDENISPEKKEQLQKIEEMVDAKRDSFLAVQDEECMARARAEAIVKADSIMAAAKPMRTPKSGKKKDPTPAKPTEPKDDKPASKADKARDKRGVSDKPSKADKAREKRGEDKKPSKADRARSRRSGEDGGGDE